MMKPPPWKYSMLARALGPAGSYCRVRAPRRCSWSPAPDRSGSSPVTRVPRIAPAQRGQPAAVAPVARTSRTNADITGSKTVRRRRSVHGAGRGRQPEPERGTLHIAGRMAPQIGPGPARATSRAGRVLATPCPHPNLPLPSSSCAKRPNGAACLPSYAAPAGSTASAGSRQRFADGVEVLPLPPWDVLPYDRAAPPPRWSAAGPDPLRPRPPATRPRLLLTSAEPRCSGSVRRRPGAGPTCVLRPGDTLDLEAFRAASPNAAITGTSGSTSPARSRCAAR